MSVKDFLRTEGIDLDAMQAELARLTKENQNMKFRVKIVYWVNEKLLTENQKLEEEIEGLKRRLGELEKENGAVKRQLMRAQEALDPRNRW